MLVDNYLQVVLKIYIFGILNPQMLKNPRGTFVENLCFTVNKRWWFFMEESPLPNLSL